jgi:hypothetical protein
VPPVTGGAVYAANLAWAAEQAKPAGVRLVIEPINHRDMPGYFLNTRRRGRGDRRRSGATGWACSSTSITADHRGRHHQADGAASCR